MDGNLNSGSETPPFFRTRLASAGPVRTAHARSAGYVLWFVQVFFDIGSQRTPMTCDTVEFVALVSTSEYAYHADEDAEKGEADLPLIEAVVVLEYECECLLHI